MAGLRQPIGGPNPIHLHLEDGRGVVPAGRENRLTHILAAVDFDERFLLDDGPAGAIEFGQPAIAGSPQEIGILVGVVRHVDPLAAGVATLEVGVGRLRHVEFGHQVGDLGCLQRLQVELEQQPLHRERQHLRLGLVGMLHRRRQPVLTEDVHRPDIPLVVDHVRTDQDLVRRRMHHPVGIGADHTLRMLLDVHVVIDRPQPGPGPTPRQMRHVRHHPELARPRQQRPDPGLRPLRHLVGLHRQVRKHPAHVHMPTHVPSPLHCLVLFSISCFLFSFARLTPSSPTAPAPR